MTNDEVIILDKMPLDRYDEIARIAARYALISIGFTYNRMDKLSILSRIKNIIKGKIAEGVFYSYCASNDINIDTTACSTPFWLPDLRDFLWLGGEWDIKNNYFICPDQNFSSYNCSLLPALIPNKTIYDQWSKRNDILIETSRFSAYLFTFTRLLPNLKEFFTLNLSPEQLDFLSNIEESTRNTAHRQMPFLETWFFEEMAKKGSDKYITLHYLPDMLLTGCANSRYFHLFKNTSARELEENYKYFEESSGWYVSQKDVLKFMDGTLTTKIKNRTCPIKLLPSFRSIVKNTYGR